LKSKQAARRKETRGRRSILPKMNRESTDTARDRRKAARAGRVSREDAGDPGSPEWMRREPEDGPMRDPAGRLHDLLIRNILFALACACFADAALMLAVSALKSWLQVHAGADSVLLGLLEMETLMDLFYVIFGILLFALLFLRRLSGSVRSLGAISTAMQDISEGDLYTSVEVTGDDEISRMGDSLNKMVNDLRTLMDREREAERTKNELITNVAHDLRTPLTSIIGYLELLSQNPDMPEETKKRYVDIAFSKSRRLQQLIEDLFSFTKLGNGKVSLRVSRVDIVRLVSQLLEEFYPSFLESGMTYELTSNVPAKVISADGDLLARLFDNLINNAIKYGADGKKISVDIEAEEDWVTVSVRNYGYVIPEEELPNIFRRFYRVEQSRSSSTGGTGLGLAIVKNIVDMHGGTVDVRSDLDGTVFRVRLRTELPMDRKPEKAGEETGS
jgi:two-component system sensor histidine kinase VanS